MAKPRLTKGQQKLAAHRDRALKRGMTRADYARYLALAPQRIGRLLGDGAPPPLLAEALLLQERCKIAPKLWFQPAE